MSDNNNNNNYNYDPGNNQKVIHWELSQKFKFDHTNKMYMHNRESVQENVTHKLFWDFERQMDDQISARRPDLVIVNKNEPPEYWTLPFQLTTG